SKDSDTPLVTAGATLSNSTFKYDATTGPVNVTATTYPDLWLAGNGTTNTFNLAGNIACSLLRIYGNGSGKTTVLNTTASNYSITCGELKVGNTVATTYGTLTLNNSTVTINGNATIYASDASGENQINAGGATLNVAGDWTNSDAFTASSSTVVLNGTDQTLTGSTTFYNLSKTESTNNATDSILTFDNTATQTINGTLTLDGLDVDDRINLVSNSPGTQWSLALDAAAIKAIDYVDVQDSDASGSHSSQKPVNPTNSVSSGNNFGWFPAVVSGTVYTDEGTTTIADGATVRLLVNGVDRGNTTTASGAYTITPSVTLVAGDAILVYIDNHATDGVAVTVASGNDISSFNLYGSHVITRHDNSGTLTNAHMATAKGKGGSGDADIIYSVDGSNNLTVSGAGTELYIWSGYSYAPGANVTTPALESLGTFNGGTGIITVNGTFTQSGGTFTATSGTTFVSGDFTVSGGTFTHNSGTVVLEGSNKTVNTGATVLNHVALTSG
ncbi:MAG: hypothetical protein FD130_2120, partial [Halothiobacillaceae bacterium]